MQEWAVALILIGVSVVVAAGLLGICRLLGGWTWVYAWVSGNKEERAQLAANEVHGGSNYMMELNYNQLLEQQIHYSYAPPSPPPSSHQKFQIYQHPSHPETGSVVPLMPSQDIKNNVKSEGEKHAIPSHPVPSIPPPPNETHGRRLSFDITRRSSIDAEISDVLGSSGKLQRAMSCDSVCSDTSVVLEALDSPKHTGELQLALEYSCNTEELIVIITKAQGLVSTDLPDKKLDCYIRICLLPDQSTNMQTAVQHGNNSPEFNERFSFGVKEKDLNQRAVQCLVYACDKYSNTLIGETDLRLTDVDLRQSYQTWLPIVDSKLKAKGLGELLFSLSYLPTAERLTVVVVKARNLSWTENKENADPFVKIYLLQKGKKISKKKTSIKRHESNPTFNEAMIFSVPGAALQNIQLRLTMAEYQADGKTPSIGHVFVGPQCSGKSLSHWNQMMSSPRKPTAMWHPLRKKDA